MMFASITNYPFLIKQSLQIVDKVQLMKYFLTMLMVRIILVAGFEFGIWFIPWETISRSKRYFYVIIRYHVDFYDGMILY